MPVAGGIRLAVSSTHVQRSDTVHVSASVVIPTRGRPQLLERCLESVCRQTLPAERYEIIRRLAEMIPTDPGKLATRSNLPEVFKTASL